MYNTSIEN